MFNPIQLVEKHRLYIPNIRKHEIIWYTIHMATINGPVIKMNMSARQMMIVELFRQARLSQHRHKPVEHIATNDMLLRYLSGAKKLSYESFDGGVTWKEVPWESFT